MSEVFIMEDFAPLRRVLTAELRDGGHNVTALENGVESTDSNFLDNADVLVTDIEMPEVDGYEVTKNIRRSHPDLPIIVITGRSAEETQRIDCDVILRKPLSEGALAKTVAAHMPCPKQAA